MAENKNKGRFLIVSKYAELCGTGVHAIHQRLAKSQTGKLKPEDEGYLEQGELEEVPGVPVIDTFKFPPKKFSAGRKKNKQDDN